MDTDEVASHARSWGVSEATATDWLTVWSPAELRAAKLSDHIWVFTEHGLSAHQVRELSRQVPDAAAGALGKMVWSARLAGLDLRWLPYWVDAWFPPGRPHVSAWVTEARRYLAAAGGDEQIAALAAAGGVGLVELAEQVRTGQADRDGLRMLAAWRKTQTPAPGAAG